MFETTTQLDSDTIPHVRPCNIAADVLRPHQRNEGHGSSLESNRNDHKNPHQVEESTGLQHGVVMVRGKKSGGCTS